MKVIGLMSGTSYDAIDAAATELTLADGVLTLTPLGMISTPYAPGLRSALAGALPPSRTTLAEVCRLDTLIGQAFASLAVRANDELCAGQAELIASHGQTVYHWVSEGEAYGTLQLGQSAWIAEATGLTVVSDFRPRDLAAGGQGAPLVSLLDVLWLQGRPGTPVALNLGGIANITAFTGSSPLAFDTGPANALLDAAVQDLTGGRLAYDAEGAFAASGQVHDPLLRQLLAEPYYRLPTPKTTGKELFHLPYLRTALADFTALPAADVLATLTRLTARTVADAVRPLGATEVIASGGGTRNPTLMTALRDELGPGAPLRTSDVLGLPSDAKEACAFALLGFLTLHGLPGNVPSCTGARGPRVLGTVTPGTRPLLPHPASAPVRRLVLGRAPNTPPAGAPGGSRGQAPASPVCPAPAPSARKSPFSSAG
ncbi:anhydro-N-acetylmuramic acid kinase [Streptomyces sp. NBC_00237]|uniref:anhydro-N-acetylmuramic acid kinase n=1 Tax=Streptomyces sp. NBC_00237 TaxID=2975687 RepID=UPI0022530AD1|nr:anhydro-N-acetylmuramic acid kinase [Streptomyces sp. NBC_00237]MCX5202842.1 anhydro-N-acetylmuramic acid kinase [Streptomyces sp. NBC_00237]